MQNKQLTHYLDKHNITYATINHKEAFTSQEVAENAHISAKELAKTLVLKVDGKLCIVVLRADHQLSLRHLKKELHAKKVSLAEESEFESAFPNCEVGGMPPIGTLYNMKVLADKTLEQNRHIGFSAGNHKELIWLNFKDWKALEKPNMVDVAR